MADALTGAALFILAVTAVGLFRTLRAGAPAERLMAVQLLGTGGGAALLLLGVASGAEGVSDVALLLVLFAAFSCAAFALGGSPRPEEGEDGG